MFPDEQWSPLSLVEVRAIFEDAPFAWGLGGGYVIECFLGAPTRKHDDVDIVIFRDEQLKAQAYLSGWLLFAADPPGTLRPWRDGEYLPFGIHDIWAHRPGAHGWEFQFMVAEAEGGEWYHRRSPAVRGVRGDLLTEYGGFPCVRVEVQLAYKAKHNRPKDTQDFAACLPYLNDGQKAWLANSLRILYSDEHPWLEALQT